MWGRLVTCRRLLIGLIPLCPFKIPNSVISLELSIVRDASEINKWDGVVRARPQWNRDQTLASAFAVSALWY